MYDTLFIGDELVDINLLIPSKKEIDNCIKNIEENRKLTIEDMFTLKKLKIIKMILILNGKRI